MGVYSQCRLVNSKDQDSEKQIRKDLWGKPFHANFGHKKVRENNKLIFWDLSM